MSRLAINRCKKISAGFPADFDLENHPFVVMEPVRTPSLKTPGDMPEGHQMKFAAKLNKEFVKQRTLGDACI